MTLFCKLSRKHYWCTPHRSEDNRLVQVCYECGSERPARELHSEPVPVPMKTRVMPKTKPGIAVGQGTAFVRLTLVK